MHQRRFEGATGLGAQSTHESHTQAHRHHIAHGLRADVPPPAHHAIVGHEHASIGHFQRVIPRAARKINRVHLHTVSLGVFDERARRVESHRLRVENGGGVLRRVVVP